MTFTTTLPYIQLLAGAYLMYLSTIWVTRTIPATLWYKMTPFILGLITIFDAIMRLGFIVRI